MASTLAASNYSATTVETDTVPDDITTSATITTDRSTMTPMPDKSTAGSMQDTDPSMTVGFAVMTALFVVTLILLILALVLPQCTKNVRRFFRGLLPSSFRQSSDKQALSELEKGEETNDQAPRQHAPAKEARHTKRETTERRSKNHYESTPPRSSVDYMVVIDPSAQERKESCPYANEFPNRPPNKNSLKPSRSAKRAPPAAYDEEDNYMQPQNAESGRRTPRDGYDDKVDYLHPRSTQSVQKATPPGGYDEEDTYVGPDHAYESEEENYENLGYQAARSQHGAPSAMAVEEEEQYEIPTSSKQ